MLFYYLSCVNNISPSMVDREKKIELVQVTVNSRNDVVLTFNDILNCLFESEEATFTEDERDTDVKLLRQEDEFIVGIVNTTKRSGIPPKRDSVTKIYESLDIDSTRSGLGYPNVFLFERNHNILMYEFNKNGCYLNFFKRYLERMCRRVDSSFPNFDLEFSAVLNADSYSRMINMTQYKQLEVAIANPVEIMNNELHNEALILATRQSVEAQSKRMTMVFNAGRSRVDGLRPSFVTSLIQSVERIIGQTQSRNVKKIKLAGYYMDPDEGMSKKTEIDFILDRYKAKITISEPSVLVDNQEEQRETAIVDLYRRCLDDLNEIFGS